MFCAWQVARSHIYHGLLGLSYSEGLSFWVRALIWVYIIFLTSYPQRKWPIFWILIESIGKWNRPKVPIFSLRRWLFFISVYIHHIYDVNKHSISATNLWTFEQNIWVNSNISSTATHFCKAGEILKLLYLSEFWSKIVHFFLK